jgi:hypothetical protein
MAEAKEKPAAKKPSYPDTPSGKALQEVGDLNGEELDDPQDGLEHGEAYQAAKKKARWG